MSEAARNIEGTDPKEQRDALESMGYKCAVIGNMSDEEGVRMFESTLEKIKKSKKPHEIVEDGNLKEVWVKEK